MDRIRSGIEAEGRPATLRKLGGILFGIGMFMVFIRKGGDNFGDKWGDFALFLTLAIPAVVLYVMGLRGDRLRPGEAVIGDLAPWRIVFLVFGVLLVPMALLQLVQVFDDSPDTSLHFIWVFGLTAALAVLASRAARATYLTLLAGLALIVAWSALSDKIFDIGEHIAAYRWLLLAFAVLVTLAALNMRDRGDVLDVKRSNELITVAGIAAVIAGALSITNLAGSLTGGLASGGVDSSLWWEIVLLVVSVALIAYASYAGARGPAYVGGIGLFMFSLIAGLDYNSGDPQNKLLGWPALLVALGALALVMSLRGERPAARPSRAPEAPRRPAGAPEAGSSEAPPGP